MNDLMPFRHEMFMKGKEYEGSMDPLETKRNIPIEMFYSFK